MEKHFFSFDICCTYFNFLPERIYFTAVAANKDKLKPRVQLFRQLLIGHCMQMAMRNHAKQPRLLLMYQSNALSKSNLWHFSLFSRMFRNSKSYVEVFVERKEYFYFFNSCLLAISSLQNNESFNLIRLWSGFLNLKVFLVFTRFGRIWCYENLSTLFYLPINLCCQYF